MQAIAIFENGKITNNLAIQLFKDKTDGPYLIEIVPLYPKSSEENRAKFFFRVRYIAKTIGDEPQDVYERFKQDMEVGSMKGDHTIEEWDVVNHKLSEWAWSKLEMILK